MRIYFSLIGAGQGGFSGGGKNPYAALRLGDLVPTTVRRLVAVADAVDCRRRLVAVDGRCKCGLTSRHA